MINRKDYGRKADSFFSSLNRGVSPLARELRGIVRTAVPSATESIKWGIPVYQTDKLICAIRVGTDYVALQFYGSGTKLPDPQKLLEGTGKRMRHLKVRSKSDIRKTAITALVRQAVKLS